MSQKKAVVLVSGGLDSTTVLAIARSEGYACYSMSFDYGQRHSSELLAAERTAKALGAVAHKVIKLDLRSIGGSALTDDAIAVPEEETGGIPVTYVPARNTVFLSIALGWAEVLGCDDIFIGVNAVDFSGYPDCRPEYIAAYEVTGGIGNTGLYKTLLAQTAAVALTAGFALVIRLITGHSHTVIHAQRQPQLDDFCFA